MRLSIALLLAATMLFAGCAAPSPVATDAADDSRPAAPLADRVRTIAAAIRAALASGDTDGLRATLEGATRLELDLIRIDELARALAATASSRQPLPDPDP